MSIALQAIHSTPIVTKAIIQQDLLTQWLPDGEFTISIEADTIEEMSRLWQAFTVPIRLSALMQQRVVYVMTHDSIGLGEDGKTHQPIEQLITFRAMPNMVVIRPGDANEAAYAWKVALERKEGPTMLVLTRQKLPVFDREKLGAADGVVELAVGVRGIGPGRWSRRRPRRPSARGGAWPSWPTWTPTRPRSPRPTSTRSPIAACCGCWLVTCARPWPTWRSAWQ